ncbi:hypothetical protein [Microscilla marina]|nr:hypothetical protein [Microscilla marina]
MDSISNILAVLPDKAINTTGKKARHSFVRVIRRLWLSWGRHQGAWEGGFLPETNTLFKKTSLDQTWWQGFASAIICQAMYQTGYLSELNEQRINYAINGYNATLRSRAWGWYVYLFAEDLQERLPKDSKNNALKKAYLRCLSNTQWIEHKRLFFQCKKNDEEAAWEMYHHYVKFVVLGATEIEIRKVIRIQINEGLMTEPMLLKFKFDWRLYCPWFSRPISWKDLPDLEIDTIPYDFLSQGNPGFKYVR